MKPATARKLAIPRCVEDELGWYVYRLVDPRDGRTFYIGKGKGSRILAHLEEAKDNPRVRIAKLARIRSIEASGDAVELIIHRHGLQDEQTAYEIEAALIDCYADLVNLAGGHHSNERGAMTLAEAIAQYDAPPGRISEAVALINIGVEWHRGLPGSAERLYERTRRYWAINPSLHPAKYAMAVARGIVREVYRIDKWERVDTRQEEFDNTRLGATIPKRAIRWAFTGSVAPEMQHYVGKSVTHYRKHGNANPVIWLNC